CDSIELNGEKKSRDKVRSTYNHAQKIRAAMTFTFNRLGHGLEAWHESEVTGEMKGNPSVSQALTSYMVSLRRRKVQEGETPTSSRAVTAEIIGQMFDFNHQPENWELGSYKPTSRKDARKQWGGPNFRRLLQVAYTAAFLCLLRFDEVLKIQVHEIEPVPGNDHILKITLPFRKTDQFGGRSLQLIQLQLLTLYP
ncbi:hypothetical protein K435DRAFT_684977, partial [Dendrothele bispora CBS 962.96]